MRCLRSAKNRHHEESTLKLHRLDDDRPMGPGNGGVSVVTEDGGEFELRGAARFSIVCSPDSIPIVELEVGEFINDIGDGKQMLLSILTQKETKN